MENTNGILRLGKGRTDKFSVCVTAMKLFLHQQ